MYPPAAMQLSRRTSSQGCTIDGRYIPGGTYVGVPYFSAFRSHQNFTRAEEWLPERWLDEGKGGFEGDVKEVMQPFSLGPHSCLGVNLAWAEIRLVLCKLLWGFDLELCPEQEGWMEVQKVFLVWEKPGLRVRVRERKFE